MFGETLLTESVTGSVELHMFDGPSSEDLVEIDPDRFPKLMGARYLVTLHLDKIPNNDETIVGTSMAPLP